MAVTPGEVPWGARRGAHYARTETSAPTRGSLAVARPRNRRAESTWPQRFKTSAMRSSSPCLKGPTSSPRRISSAALTATESSFFSPPVGSYQERDIPFVRFPRWRVCPSCNMLSNQFRFPSKADPNAPPVPRCDRCNRETFPARLVVACEKGHIDDFPWR